jgi:hypothetical protein
VGVPYNIYGLLNSNGWTLNGTNPVAVFQSNSNVNADIIQVLPQNQTQGQALTWSGLHSIGASASVAMSINAKGGGQISLNDQNTGGWVQSFTHLLTVNNNHISAQLNGGVQPSIYSCSVAAGVRGGSTDVSGQVIFGATGSITSCLINFGTLWGNAPNCVCSFEQGNGIPTGCGTNTSTSQVNFQVQGSVTNTSFAQINWICIGI